MKFLKSPLVKTVLLIVAVGIAVNMLRPQLQRIPVIGQYI